jgi:hypothetical protein
MKKKYFVLSHQKKNVIVSLPSVPKGYESKYVELTEEQLKFQEENPTASTDEVFQCKMHETVSTIIEEDLEQYKKREITVMSELSLSTSRQKVSDYQFLNAQASLLVEDGVGIYTHEKANEVITAYNTIGKKCREKYYEFVENLNSCTVLEIAKELVETTKQWYASV